MEITHAVCKSGQENSMVNIQHILTTARTPIYKKPNVLGAEDTNKLARRMCLNRVELSKV